MPRVALSVFTADDMRLAIGACGTTIRGMAIRLGVSRSTMGAYVTGRCAVPQHVADRVRTIIVEHSRKWFTPEQAAQLATLDLAARTNAERNTERLQATGHALPPGYTKGRLPKRQKDDPLLRTVHPPYRVRERYSVLLVAALRHWAKVIHERTRHEATSSPAHLRDYALEMADIKAIMIHIPQDVRGGTLHAFDIQITEAEWKCISRALRNYAEYAHPQGKRDGPAHVFYQHWRKHRFAGYPFVPMATREERNKLFEALIRK